MRRKGLLVVVSGPSGVGKSTLCKKMTSLVPGTTLSISYTTRNPRPAEEEGIDYCFVDKKQFEEMVQREEFAEWAEVYGNLYGTPKKGLLQAMEEGIDVLLDIDAQGAQQIMKQFADAVYVFVVPPSLETLRERLLNRKGDSEEEVHRRFQKASDEIMNFKSYNYVVRNADLLQAAHGLEAVMLAERAKTTRLGMEWLVENGLLPEGESRTV